MAPTAVRDRVVARPVASFFVLAYAVSWLGFLPSAVGIDRAFGGSNLLIAQYNHTGSVLLMMLLHGGFNTATVHLVPFADELVFGPTYATLLTVQIGVLLVAVLSIVALTGGRLGYDADDVRRGHGEDGTSAA
ncbi:hypothetical protein [Natrinema caseinilyticum]|uniref:hypothetical protein n=1 Tax=Natrinema caseinilyticum TaxID=2961570 RepID=UPI0020C4585F|nr:hypothetical protein [Natrinema caseinilyticum]